MNDTPHPNPPPQGGREIKRTSVATERGFTLIEMLLVVIIISTLAAMIVPRFAGRSDEAKTSAAQADINANIASALDLYELDNGGYPQTLDNLLVDPGNARKWRGPYLKKKKGLKDPWGRPYSYRSPGVHNADYDLSSTGADGQDGTPDDVTNWESEK
jgi:general secretion pathway protein G